MVTSGMLEIKSDLNSEFVNCKSSYLLLMMAGRRNPAVQVVATPVLAG